MPVHVCLLRAIGPGTHAIMSMTQLRDACAGAGFTDVSSYVATGNLLLRSSDGAAAVRDTVQGLVDGFGLKSEVFVRTRAQMLALAKANPFAEAAENHPGRLGVCFFHRARRWPEALLNPAGPEQVSATGATIVIDYGPGAAPSRLDVERLCGATMTQRNWNTVMGLAKRLRAMD